MKTTYTYTVLRYIHDPSTGEFVNVGVTLYAPEARFAGVLCRTTFERFSRMFPDFDGNAFRSVMRFVNSQFNAANEKLQENGLFADRPKSIMELAYTVLPHDDASFHWSEPGEELRMIRQVRCKRLLLGWYQNTTRRQKKGGATKTTFATA